MLCCRQFFCKRLSVVFVLLLCSFGLRAQEEEPFRVVVQEGQGSQTIGKSPRNYDFSYTLGLEYDYMYDLPRYSDISFYKMWQEDMLELSGSLIDPFGAKGHALKLVNAFEWRWDTFSISAFANLTMNYLPAFFDTAFNWVPACWNGALRCFKACNSIMKWSISDGWLLVNLVSVFIVPAAGVLLCGLSGVVCLVAIPASVLSLTIPMFDLGGSVDYHPFTNDNVDTKLSLGLNLDGYRFIYHAGIGGLFTQAEASLKFNHFKLYAQAGYRFDIVNIAGSIKTASGTAPKDGEIKYVPAPYVKAGMGFRF